MAESKVFFRDEIISGPSELQGHTVWVHLAAGPYPQGYIDPDIEPGDTVDVYGLYIGEDYLAMGDSVALYGSEDYYIKKTAIVAPFTFVHLTDPHIGYLPEEYPPPFTGKPGDMVESIEKFTDTLQDVKIHNPDFIPNTGDIVEYNNSDFFNAYVEIMKSICIPVYHTPGNHDGRTGALPPGDDALANYHEYIKNPGPNIAEEDYLIKPDNYTFEHKGYLFIGLDSGADYGCNNPIGTPEGSGLDDSQNETLNEADIKDYPRKIILMHHPATNEVNDKYRDDLDEPVPNNCPGGGYGGDDMCIAFHRCDFIDYSIDNHVDLVLTGHTHKDYEPIIFNDAGTHKTRFIQTRSATKDEHGYKHGYRVINITEGVISNQSETTPSLDKSTFTLSLANPYEKPEEIWGISAYDLDGRHTGALETGKIEREIPDSYYTGYYNHTPTETPQVLVVYPNRPLDIRIQKVTPSEGVSNMMQEPTTASEEIYLNFSIRDHTGTEIIEYRYDNVGLIEGSTASVDLTSPEPDYTMEIDDNGDGVTDRTKEPEVVVTREISIPLHAGWNLISLPVVPENSSIDSVFSSIAGNYSVVWTTTSTGGWKSSNQAFGKRTDMSPGNGYMIYAPVSGSYTVS